MQPESAVVIAVSFLVAAFSVATSYAITLSRLKKIKDNNEEWKDTLVSELSEIISKQDKLMNENKERENFLFRELTRIKKRVGVIELAVSISSEKKYESELDAEKTDNDYSFQETSKFYSDLAKKYNEEKRELDREAYGESEYRLEKERSSF